MLQSGTSSQSAWVQFNVNTVAVQIDFPSSFPGGTPNVVASLVCDSQPQPPTTGIRIMNVNNVNFMALLQLADGSDLAVSEANAFNWRVAWIADN